MKIEELTALGIPEEAAKKALAKHAKHEAEVSAETKKLTDNNAGRLGVTVPQKQLDVLMQLKEKGK